MNTTTKKLQWSIDGEWLTDFVRNMFWNEDKPYEDVAKILSECIQTDDTVVKDRIVQDIIEGRKKFVGVNEFELVDDNEFVRSLASKINELKKENAILKIKNEIQIHGIDYVDPYSVIKSIDAAIEANIVTAEECICWFHYPDWDFHTALRDREDLITLSEASEPTEAGLWLLNRPEVVYKATNNDEVRVGSKEFWDNIYEITKNWEGFEFRNKLYKMQRQLEDENVDFSESKTFTDGPTHNKGYGRTLNKDNSLPSWSGLIAPNGDFYPCDFGSHEGVAYQILEDEFKSTRRNESFDKLYNQALSILIDEKKWVACRYLNTRGHYIVYPEQHEVTSHWKPTDEQKDVVWRLVAMHHEHVSSKVVPEVFF